MNKIVISLFVLALVAASSSQVIVGNGLIGPAVVPGAPLSNAYTSHYPNVPVIRTTVVAPLVQRLAVAAPIVRPVVAAPLLHRVAAAPLLLG